jgi:hypothetical protein
MRSFHVNIKVKGHVCVIYSYHLICFIRNFGVMSFVRYTNDFLEGKSQIDPDL